ncbi:phosphoheptose isomerase [Magnetococcus marinus MC-1]|uniref:Phosphoheptose isomerase n=1 Tax=Magnetococcus marinus (strain ATCC BAA-1437 / JCM 17883 / MC-1) TaxID=156889 RepID=A0LA18_MAGMM|nr:SIS domain-containing protein [Magnetococcus marinus]ABK44811.1 phosphoheptose isomerase [Magnetococcus marinus MC-1]
MPISTQEQAERYARDLFQRSLALKARMLEGAYMAQLASMGQVIANALAAGNKLLLCGNGGSAADAQHLAAELLVRLRSHINRPGLPAMSLAMDASAMTACGNDYSYAAYYGRMVQALGVAGDVLLGITTSGRSPNVLHALEQGRKQGLITMGLLGGDGGPALALCDHALVVPDKETGRVQEMHITAGHVLMELTEEFLLTQGYIEAEG